MNTPQTQTQTQTLSAFDHGYIEALFFTNGGGEPEDELTGMDSTDFASETLKRIVDDCCNFRHAAAKELEAAHYEYPEYDLAQAGRDFWFSRCGHGVGYWDRGLSVIGDQLHAIAQTFSHVDPYVGDDGLIYLL